MGRPVDKLPLNELYPGVFAQDPGLAHTMIRLHRQAMMLDLRICNYVHDFAPIH
jgi:hypothetical protein